MKELGNLLITLFYKLVSLIIIILPDQIRFKVGVLLGKLLRKTVTSYNETAYNNMRLVLKDELSPAEMERLLEENFTHMGLVIAEFIITKKLILILQLREKIF